MSPRPGGDVANSAEFAIVGSGERPVYVPPAKPSIARYVTEHPAFIVVVSYLLLAIVGVTYDVLFYRRFRINILAYVGGSDLAFAPLRNPAPVLLALLPAAALLAFVSWRSLRKKGSDGTLRFPRPRPGMPGWRMIAYGAAFCASALVLTQLSANRSARRAITGSGQRVTFARNDGLNHAERPVLLGSTANFFFLYYPSRKVTEIVPVENTALLTVEARSQSERARDSAAGISGTPSTNIAPLSP